MSDVIARRFFHVGQSRALWFAFVLVQLVCFWLRRCFLLSRMLAKTDPTHIHQVLYIGGSKLCFIISPALRQAMVLIHGLNGTLAGQLMLCSTFFSPPYFITKTRSSMVYGLSIPVQKVKK